MGTLPICIIVAAASASIGFLAAGMLAARKIDDLERALAEKAYNPDSPWNGHRRH